MDVRDVSVGDFLDMFCEMSKKVDVILNAVENINGIDDKNIITTNVDYSERVLSWMKEHSVNYNKDGWVSASVIRKDIPGGSKQISDALLELSTLGYLEIYVHSDGKGRPSHHYKLATPIGGF